MRLEITTTGATMRLALEAAPAAKFGAALGLFWTGPLSSGLRCWPWTAPAMMTETTRTTTTPATTPATQPKGPGRFFRVRLCRLDGATSAPGSLPCCMRTTRLRS